MAVFGSFFLQDYTHENGVWLLHFVNPDPGGGNVNDYYLDVPDSELPANINQNTLLTMLKQRLGWKVNMTFAPLNQFIANGTPVVLP